ncbi:hypothetical protein [Gordonia sp. (in: high G+C Gram-positive bacteria)]|uniref:hypothetical protein n=1 Tax=Gordonia sp. (in: high G+C Gram-positive bacteria) TaxID=84139 RepID=UPI003C73CC3B
MNLTARVAAPRARIAAQVEEVPVRSGVAFVWRCLCGSEVTSTNWFGVVRTALDHSDHCIESDHKGEA